MKTTGSRDWRSPTIRAVLGGFTLALGVASGCHREAPAPENHEAKTPAGETAGGPRWDDGGHYAYRVSIAGKTEMGKDNVVLDFTLTGELELWASARRAGAGKASAIELAARLRDVKVEGQSTNGDANFAELQKELSRSWVAVMHGGQVEEVLVPRGTTAAAAGVERTLAAALQFTSPPAGGGKSSEWDAVEHDATGRYAVRYRASAEPGRFTRSKLRYQSVLVGFSDLAKSVRLAPGLSGDPPEIASSRGDVELAPDGRLRAVHAEEAVRARLNAGVPVSSQTRLSLVLGSADRAARPADLAVGAGISLARVRATEPYAAPTTPLNLDAAKTAGWTFDKALAAIAELDRTRPAPAPAAAGQPQPQDAAENARAQQTANAFNALTTILRLQPEARKRATAIIRKNGPASSVLMNALSASTAGGSQAALLELAKDRKLPERLRKKAAGSLIRTERPTAETVAGVTELLDDPVLGIYATYGLGMYARRLRTHGEAERTHSISVLLAGRLETARGPAAKSTALRGIANSGDAGALPRVRPYLTNKDPLLRAAAIEAVRLMDHPEIDGLIAGTLKRESGNIVRNAALGSAQARPASATLEAAVEEVASKAPDSYGRLQAVRLLARWLPDRTTTVRPALEKIAAADAEPRVRDEARRALDRLAPRGT